MCSTGIGGPSTSIAVEELAQLGVRTFLRVGTTGAIQPDIAVADVIVTTGSVRLDGASLHFAPLEYPAVAHFDCMTALVDAARELGHTVHVGITVASDTFYPGQERYDTVSGYVRRSLQGSRDEWAALHVLNYEMESATLFTMCAANGWRAGMVAGVLVNRTQQEIPDAACTTRSRRTPSPWSRKRGRLARSTRRRPDRPIRGRTPRGHQELEPSDRARRRRRARGTRPERRS